MKNGAGNPDRPGDETLPGETAASRKRLAGTFNELQSIINAISDIIYVVDLKGSLIKWNKAVEVVTGYPPEELHEKPAFTFFAPEERPLITEAISKCIDLGEAELEAGLLCADGTLIPYHWKGVLVKDDDGEPLWITGVGRDISEHRHTDSMLREALRKAGEEKAKTEAVISSIGDGLIIQGLDLRILYQNSISRDTVGDHVGDYCYRAILRRDGVCEDCPAALTLMTGNTHTAVKTIALKTGTRHLEITTSPLRDAKGTIVSVIKLVRDITGRKKMESALREIAERLSSATGDVFFQSVARYLSEILNVDHVIIGQLVRGRTDFVRTIAVTAFGRTAENFEYSLAGTPCENVMNQKLRSYPRDLRRIFPNNSWLAEMKIESFIGTPLFGSSGNVIGVMNVMDSRPLDNPLMAESMLSIFATRASAELERMQAEERLSEAETRYRTLFEQSPDGILLIDENGIPVEFNEAVHRQLGYTREEFKDLRISDIDPAESDAEIRKSITNVLKTGKSRFEVKHKTREGEIRDVQVIAQKLVLSGKAYLHAIWRDITDTRKMEEEFLKMEKLESLGVLAGGIAHDFNNLLVGILGNISLAKLNTDEASSVYERLLEAEKACVLAKGLTQQLLTFSRSGEPVKKIVSIGEIVRDSCVFSLSGSNVKYVTSIPDDIGHVEVDAGQISQVMNNLLINADQAMPYGGAIDVRCADIVIEDKDMIPLAAGNYVRISIIDQGAGIPEDLLSKIFDPYFTTKQTGSGLGLATCYSIVKKHGGHIEVQSQVGTGTAFHIYLPAATVEKLPAIKTPAKRLVTGQGRILLMDDEEIVRFVTVNMLKQLGYEVETASNGEEAIEIYRNAVQEGRPFSAVITDLTVRGGMGGRETAEKLLDNDPAVRMIVFSGYSDDPVTSNFRDYGFKGFLCKPCQIEELSAVLHDVTEGCKE
jgi:PAS domain S-box-containing protein